ncbi:protein FAM200C-like isoform X1 [Musca domestica]|uniref:Protein FAM200C-like isoform X1 n=1 Tax=Musca domestica TaxID=7370 RepID=A0ABM3VDJ7_MUSDO|nr:protein FAM200C-like isoform X1 [Musca domestica]
MDRFIVRSKRKADDESPNKARLTLGKGADTIIETSSESEKNTESESENDEEPSCSSKKRNISRYYSKEWEMQYRWLKQDGETKRPLCIVCKQLLSNQKNHLRRHAETKKHLSNITKTSENAKIQLTDYLPHRNTDLRKHVAIAEIKLVLRAITKNQSFNSMDGLGKFNSMIFPDSNIAKLVCKHILVPKSNRYIYCLIIKVSCGRTKSTAIAQFLGKEGQLAIVSKMQKQQFSLIIDETTDISINKCLVMVVRQFNKDRGKTEDNFFQLVQPENGKGETICNAVIESLENNKIPLENFIGFATDNASSMVGKNIGVSSLLKKKIPHLFHLGCVCHSVNLMNISALKCIPEEVEKLPKNIYNFFKSSNRRVDFSELQDMFNVPEHKLLSLSDTRWLSFESVAKRIVEQWTILQHYFLRAQCEEKCPRTMDKIRAIQDGLSSENLIYLKFLVYILGLMNKFNKCFQSESSQIVYLITYTKEILLQILQNFLKKEHISVTKLESINFKDTHNIKDVLNIYIGHEAETEMQAKNILDVECITIKNNILKFYQKLCDEILSRININDKQLNVLRVLQPTFFTSNEDFNYIDLIYEFNYIISEPEAFISEFKLLESKVNDKSYKHIFNIKNVEIFWHTIGSLKNALNEPLYLHLYDFAAHVLTLPHSSASAERIFSKLGLMKTKLTNRLNVTTCGSMLSALNLLDAGIEEWNPSDDLVQKYRNEVSKK